MKILTLIIGIALISCNTPSSHKNKTVKSSDPISKTYYIAPYKVNCTGVAPMKCLLVKTDLDSLWTNFYAPINGFVHKAGYQYIIKVSETKLTNQATDASSITYELKEIIEEKLFTQSNKNLYDIWGVVDINGVNPLEANCEQTLEINLTQKTIMGKAGCNNFRGVIKLNDNTNNIAFNKILTTHQICPKQFLEDAYLKALHSVDAFFYYNQNLLLISNGEVVIRAKRMD